MANDTAKLNTKYIISKYIYFGVRIREAVLSAATSQEAHRVLIGLGKHLYIHARESHGSFSFTAPSIPSATKTI